MNPQRVLVVDDEEELVTTFVERLQIRGLDAEAATNGHDAIERLHEVPFDVVVADLKMPGLDGLDLVQVLRQQYPDIRIVLITGHGRLDDEDELKASGVQDILAKPFSIDVLMDAIQGPEEPGHA